VEVTTDWQGLGSHRLQLPLPQFETRTALTLRRSVYACGRVIRHIS
jgi:hypothetical protein